MIRTDATLNSWKVVEMTMVVSEISAAQKASWNKFAAGWRKWDEQVMAFLGPHARAIVDHLRPSGSEVILDIAAGTGEPGLSMAAMVSDGRVVITDLSEGMLQVAKDKAAGRTTNVEFHLADACDLPFEDDSFDAVSCRLGFMFFPDMEKAAQEMARVLKPGGRIATTVWAAPDMNYWVTCMVQHIGKHIEMDPPPPGAPGMFRCAKPGLIAELFAAAGLRNVSESSVPSQLDCGCGAAYWEMMTEVAAPFVAALSKADATTVERIKADVISAMDERFPSGAIDACGTVIVADK